jgi:Na+-transporting methylmalonyl-CoA/oxaloacetate decarboxylase gamma subunit
MISVDLALFAVGLADEPTARQLVEFSLAGCAVVLLSLSILALICHAVSYVLRFTAAGPMPSKNPASKEVELSEEVVAIITAAVAEALEARHRIVHIRGLTPEDLGWSLEGRLQHHASHIAPHRHR